MSADNYYLIRKDRQGFFSPVMGFASDECHPVITSRHPRFVELPDALDFAGAEYTEYGIIIHEECYSDETPTFQKEANGHYAVCPTRWLDSIESEYTSEDFPCSCEQLEAAWEADYTSLAK